MNPWNEDRLREDSDVEDDPPSIHPVFAASPTSPSRRRSSVAGAGSSPSSLVSSPSLGRSTRRRSIASHGR